MIINLKSPTEISAFYIVYDGSTLLEGPGSRGATHILEHLMCKSFEHLQDELQSRAINWNAYTSGHEVVFWFMGLEAELAQYREKLLGLLSEFKVTEQQFETERKIVLQEYKDCMTDQYWTHYYNLMRRRFGYYDPIGLKADLEGLTLLDLQRIFGHWYARPTKIINVAKAYEFPDGFKLGHNQVAGSILMADPGPETLELDSTHEGTSCVRLQSRVPITEDIPALKIACNMLSNGLNSPLTQLIREKHGLTYGFWAQLGRYHREALITFAGTTADENVDKLLDLVNNMLQDTDKILTSERLEIVRRELQISDQIEEMERYRHINPWITPLEFQTRTIQDTVKLEEIRRVAEKYMHPEELIISVDKRDFVKAEISE